MHKVKLQMLAATVTDCMLITANSAVSRNVWTKTVHNITPTKCKLLKLVPYGD